MIPATTPQLSAARFIEATVPSYKILIALMGSEVICPIKAPKCPANANHGPMVLASSAVTDGIFSALVTAPVSR